MAPTSTARARRIRHARHARAIRAGIVAARRDFYRRITVTVDRSGLDVEARLYAIAYVRTKSRLALRARARRDRDLRAAAIDGRLDLDREAL